MNVKLDTINQKYFDALNEKNATTEARTTSLALADLGTSHAQGTVAFSTAVCPPELLSYIPLTRYADLPRTLKQHAKEAVLIRSKMYAGIGTSIRRSTHLLKHGRPEGYPLGAKGTDLFIEIPHPLNPKQKVTLCFAEVQILQGLLSQKRGEYKKVVFQDLVSAETEPALSDIWNKPCLLNPEQTYAEFVAAHESLEHRNAVFQQNLPTLNEEGFTTIKRMAPGGHGFFGFNALVRLLTSTTKATPSSVSFISNGEDLSAYPDPIIVGWMLENQVPLSMVVTEKTLADKKGGQLAVVVDSSNARYISLIETAQATASGQLALFEELGLTVKREGQVAAFNTNLAIFNESLLKKRLTELNKAVGEKALLKAIAPDIIHNWKEQKDPDGVIRRYLQLEGAMGSVFLNLDRLSRDILKQPLVHFLQIAKSERTHFFAPVKNAHDFFIQYYSGKCSWDSQRLTPVNPDPTLLPEPAIQSEDIETVLSHYREGHS